MQKPLVTVICVCHNHEPFVEEAIHSIINQTYENIEIILIDDGSMDHSPEVIEQLNIRFPNVKSILLNTGIGNCRAFNIGLERSKGEYVIDLSADDILMPKRIEEGLNCFQISGKDYGVNFTDAVYVDASGNFIKYHYQRNNAGQLLDHVPEGYIYEYLLARYFICTPSMMTRRSIYEQLGGYDENLAYEDFDFWIRSGKITRYCYTDKVLVKKRLLKNSLSTRQYIKDSKMLKSTYLVCLKAEKLNESESDRHALVQRTQFEFRKALFSGNYKIAYNFSEILLRNLMPGIKKMLIKLIRNILKS
jgi:glycosyltransferase involved in cell wall biosynthesis